MTQAIITTYHGPTNSRGSRITAKAWGGSVTIPFPHSMTAAEAHAKAAQALVEKLGWSGEWVAGCRPDDRGYVFVQAVRPDARFTVSKEVTA